MSVVRSVLLTAASIPVFHFVAVVFGAPFFSQIVETLEFAVFLSVLVTLPLCLATSAKQSLVAQLIFDFAPSTKAQFYAIRVAFGAIVGAWFGAFVIPLDWDRWWQVWPLPCLIGSTIGFVVGLIQGFIELLVRKDQFTRSNLKSKYY